MLNLHIGMSAQSSRFLRTMVFTIDAMAKLSPRFRWGICVLLSLLILLKVRRLSDSIKSARSKGHSTGNHVPPELSRKPLANGRGLRLQVDHINSQDQVHSPQTVLSKAKETIREKDATIVALRRQCRKLRIRQRFQNLHGAGSQRSPSVAQKNAFRINLERQAASRQPLDIPTREYYEHRIARLEERLAECQLLIEGGHSEDSSPTVYSPAESHHPPLQGGCKVRAPPMTYSRSV
ncbi:hypothetical protein H1R20_g2949, partial [Candolleomyces eurysporus]